MAQIKTNLLYGTTGNLPAVSGANLTSLNGTQVTSGTLPMARLSGTLPALNGSALTTLNGTQVTTGTVADARISALTSSKLTGNLPALNASALTNLDARDLENALPAISGASLTGISSDLIGFSARRDGVLSVAVDTYTKIIYNQEEWDSSSCYDTSTGTFTVPSGGAGTWVLSVTNHWTSIVKWPYTVVWYEGGVQRPSYHTVGYEDVDHRDSSSSDTYVTALSVGNTIEVYCSHYSSAARNLAGNDSYGFSTHFSAFRIAAS